MALQIIGTNSIGTGFRADLTTSDDAFLAQGATVGSTDNAAILGAGSHHFVQVAGGVFGALDGIRLGDSLTLDNGQRVVVEASAFVGSSAGFAVSANGQTSAVVNEGTVSGLYGIGMGGIGTGQSTIINSGTITGQRDAILHGTISTETLLVTNYGRIVAGGYGDDRFALDSNGTNAIEIVRNRGSIIGDIDFGSGDDSLDNRRGSIEGTVYGGDGNDTFFAGETDEIFDGGAGVDTLNLQKTAGGRVDLSGVTGGTGHALGDTYISIESVLGSRSGADTIIGSSANNALSGFGGADVLDGGAGADRLVGGAGVDTLTGGAGDDTFQFNALTDAGDVILDFSNVAGNDDIFRISAVGFGGGLVAGVLAAGQFQSRADNLAQDANDRFIFRTTDQSLWFDANGSAAGGLRLLADLQTGAVVTAADILLF